MKKKPARWEEGHDEESHEKNMRVLRNGKIIQGLPSRLLSGMDGGFKSILELPPPGDFGNVAFEEICVNLYILKYFRHNLDHPGWDSTFFSNEIEYILCGRLSDEANRNIVYLSLLAFRTAINAAHIHSDASKMGGECHNGCCIGRRRCKATPAAQAAITGIWAGAEAAMDMSRLEKGENPLIKTSEDWVLSLDMLFREIMNADENTSEDRMAYVMRNYLFLLLCFKDRESKIDPD